MIPIWGTSTGAKATLDLDFLGATSLDNRITFSRGSQATLFDSTGALVYARHNLATNSESISAFGSPTNASLTSAAISTPLPSVTTAGLLVLNVGANTGNSADGVTVINLVNLPTQTQVTYSAFVKAAGTTTFRLRSNITGSVFSFTLSGTGTAPTPSSDLQSATISALSDSWYRVAWTFTTTTGAPGARADYWTWKTDTANGIAGVYITGIQINITAMEGGVTSSLSTYYPTTTAAYYAPRFDYNPSTLAAQGLLIEEQRTNSIRNNTMQGAVAGTPGTAPTNWAVTGLGSGLTRQIIGTGTENGITYIDIRFSGTTTAASFHTIAPETIGQVAAVSGQTWTHTMYVSLVGGSTANITNFQIGINEYSSVPAYLTGSTTNFAPTSGALNTRRQTHTRTLTNASTVSVHPYMLFQYGNGAAIDITLRIGLPQLELGAFATSVIPTTTTALTRNADVASMTGTNFSSWFNASEGTLLAQGILVGGTSGTFPRQAALVGSNPDSDSIGVYWLAPSGNMAGNVRTAGVSELDQAVVPTKTAGSAFKAAVAYKTNDANNASDGNVGTTDTTVTLPTVQSLRIGGQAVFQPTASSWIQRVSYYPRRLPNSTLQALTA